jgi:hypothetical protein
MLDICRTTPSNDISRDLINHTQGEECWMSRAISRRISNSLQGRLSRFDRIKKAKIPIPRNIHQKAQTVGKGEI